MSAKHDDGGAAFPVAMSEQTISNQDSGPFQTGMSLRDYFAGEAMRRWDAGHDLLGGHVVLSSERVRLISESAYQIADAMLAARALPKKGDGQ